MATLTKKQESSKSGSKKSNAQSSRQPKQENLAAPIEKNEKNKDSATKIIVKYDAGYPNQLYIRGEGADLNWEKGSVLKNVKTDEWVWETEQTFNHCKFKVLINDKQYETGENHLLAYGSSMQYTPRFN